MSQKASGERGEAWKWGWRKQRYSSWVRRASDYSRSVKLRPGRASNRYGGGGIVSLSVTLSKENVKMLLSLWRSDQIECMRAKHKYLCLREQMISEKPEIGNPETMDIIAVAWRWWPCVFLNNSPVPRQVTFLDMKITKLKVTCWALNGTAASHCHRIGWSTLNQPQHLYPISLYRSLIQNWN